MNVITLPSSKVTATIDRLLKSTLATGATSSSLRLLSMVGEGARDWETAASRPLGTPSRTNLVAAGAAGIGAAAGDAGAAGAADVAGTADAAGAALGALPLTSAGLTASVTRRSE